MDGGSAIFALISLCTGIGVGYYKYQEGDAFGNPSISKGVLWGVGGMAGAVIVLGILMAYFVYKIAMEALRNW